MELLHRLNDLFWQLVDLFLHLDRHLEVLVETYGGWSYLLLFVVVFCETGLVVTPFLPGDSLLFGAGALAAATPTLALGWLLAVLFAAAVLGDTANYWIGRKLGPWLVHREKPLLIRQEHLDKTSRFFARYGGKTIVIARFVPVVRTFAPFVAGLGHMSYPRFMAYNVAGGAAWVLLCTVSGYLFGNLPVVQEHFSLVILGIVVVSLLPAVVEWWRARRAARAFS
ncbi:MAG TPA: DedA family protein [Thermoanaerobaculia bacterium]